MLYIMSNTNLPAKLQQKNDICKHMPFFSRFFIFFCFPNYLISCPVIVYVLSPRRIMICPLPVCVREEDEVIQFSLHEGQPMRGVVP